LISAGHLFGGLANLEGANLSYADCQNAIFRRISKDAVGKDLDDWVKK
jgi:uncharacterized protein YjbI with pentapeptide repeats